MKFAVIADIHSNIIALDRVLHDIDEQDADCIFCAGDIVGYSPFPNEAIRALRQRGIISIQGNYDRAIGNSAKICGCGYTNPSLIRIAARSMTYTNRAITEENRRYLARLPSYMRFSICGRSILIVHGSQRAINEPVTEDISHDSEAIKELGDDVLICGHTHVPFIKTIGSKCIINAGTVGKPVNGDTRASYALIDIGKSIDARIVYVEYDVETAARAIIEEKELPDDIAEMLVSGTNLVREPAICMIGE
jgi:putative phosphoesterase